MGLGLWRKLKEAAKRVWDKAKQIIPKVLPGVGKIVEIVFPAAAPFVKPATDIINNVINRQNAVLPKLVPKGIGPIQPKDDDIDSYDADNEYIKLKTGI